MFTIIFSIIYCILVYFQNVWLFLYLGQSRWEDKVTATNIRGSSKLTKTLQKGSSCADYDANFHYSFCANMAICRSTINDSRSSNIPVEAMDHIEHSSIYA